MRTIDKTPVMFFREFMEQIKPMIYPVDRCHDFFNSPLKWRIGFNLSFNKAEYWIDLAEKKEAWRAHRAFILTITTPYNYCYEYEIYYMDGGSQSYGRFRTRSDKKGWCDSEFINYDSEINKEHLGKYLLADNFWEIGQEWGKQNSNEYIIESKNFRNLSFTLKSDGSNIHIDLIED